MRPTTLALLLACALLIAVTVGAVRREAGPPATGWPELAELDSLSRYLGPARPAPDPDEYEAFIPARPAPRPTRRPAPPSGHRLSAILIAGSRRLAIIDDRNVRAGDRLPDDAVVLSIARDHVVVRERDGSLRTLRLSTDTDLLR